RTPASTSFRKQQLWCERPVRSEALRIERRFPLRFAPNVARSLIVSESNESGVPQVAIGGPFDKLEASHELGPQPMTFLHFFGSQALAPSPGVRFRKVHKWAF